MEALSPKLWDETLEQLKNTIDHDSFSAWLKPTRFQSFNGNVLTVSVPNDFCRKWLLANYLDRITQTVRALSNANIIVSFVNAADVEEGEEDASTDAAASPAEFLQARAESQRGWAESRLNPKYTLEHFVVGESNRFAHAAARAVADPLSKAYNPLFIYGGVGLGKTHLMQAVGHEFIARDKQLRVLYLTSEQFMNAFIDSITQNKQYEFRNRCRGVDLLLIDDVQFLAGKERTQTEFFHTFNALYDAGKKIVCSSDRAPKQLAMVEERLRSRFEWGLIVDIQPPDLEMCVAILKKKAQTQNIEIPNDVTLYIAERIQSNIRELEGALTRLKAYSVIHDAPIDLRLTKEVIGHLFGRATTRKISVEEVQSAVCQYFDIRPGDLLGTSRLKKFSMPRHIAQYLCRTLTGLSLPEIGVKFGGRDHTSVLHACRKIDKTMAEDHNLKSLINYLTKKIKEKS
jgi:chromosomal replication initiator protein